MLHPTLDHRKAQLKQTLEEEEEEAVVALVEALMEGANPQYNDHTASNMTMPIKTKMGTGEPPANILLRMNMNNVFLTRARRAPSTDTLIQLNMFDGTGQVYTILPKPTPFKKSCRRHKSLGWS